MNSRYFTVDLKLQCLHNLRLYSGFVMLLAYTLLSINQSLAESWQNSVSTQLTTEYNSNPTLNATNPGGVSRAILYPSYALVGQLADNQSVKLGAALQIVRSSNESLTPNRNSPTLFLDWSRQFETGEVGLGSKYTEDSTRYLGGIDATAPVESTRTSKMLLFRASKALNERSTLATSGTYESVNYKGGTFTDYITRSADLTYSYMLNERITPFFRIAYFDFYPIGGNTTSRLDAASVGLNWKISDNLESSFLVGTTRNSNDEVSTQNATTLKYQSQKSQLNLNASRQNLPSGISGFITTNKINGGWSYAISEINKIGIDALWQQSHLITDVIFRTEGVWLQTELSPLWNLRSYYQHYTIDRGSEDEASSNILGLSLAYSHPDF